MKKIIPLMLCIMLSSSLLAQHKFRAFGWTLEREVPKNEVKLNLPMTIFGSFPEVSYERFINKDMSVGATFGVGLDIDRVPINWIAMPHYRWYFGGNRKATDKYGAGLFVEVNAAVFSKRVNQFEGSLFDYDTSSVNISEKDITTGGLGLALGWKYVTTSNWVAEIYGGAGRAFSDEVSTYPRMGITIGKRF